jgi:hypothetical protein
MNVIQLQYDGKPVEIDENGWFNATEAADKFGKRPVDWLALDSTDEYISAVADIFKCEKSSLLKTKRGKHGGGTWLHPKLAVRFAQWLDIRFAVWCDAQIDAMLRGKDDRQKLRHAAASSFKVMNAVLLVQREHQGKTTASYHYSNEARLVNWALTGEFKSLDRDSLIAQDLDLLAKLEERNTVLIGCGLAYDERKLALERFSAEARQIKSLEAAA